MKIVRPITVGDSGSFTRASPASYYDKLGVYQSALSDVPRYSYDPSDLSIPPTLMLEKTTTNVVTFSEDFTDSSYVKTQCSVSPNTDVSPDGTTSVDTVTAVAGQTSYVQKLVYVNQSTDYSVSEFIKAGTATTTGLKVYNSGSVALIADLTISWTSGVPTISGTTGTWKVAPTITKIGTTGMYRVGGVINSGFNISLNVRKYPDLGNSGLTSKWWGLQVAAESTVSSYIKTTSALVTRAADVNSCAMLSNITENDYLAWVGTKIYTLADRVMVIGSGVHQVYESLVGVSALTTFTSGSNLISIAGYTPVAGHVVSFTNNGANFPSNLVAGTVYYVSAIGITPTTFQISATLGGSVITLSLPGTSNIHGGKASANFNLAPATNPDQWLYVGSTNRWSMFDLSVESQTTNADFINATILLSSLVDCVGLLNVDGVNSRVVLTDPVDGVVFDQTFSLIADSNITDPYAYAFEPTVRLQDYFLTGLLPYLNAYLSITICANDQTAKCGVCIPGLSKEVGYTQSGMTIGIQDFSIKTKDTFGNSEITERSYNVRTSLSVWVENAYVDTFTKLLASYRATPILYVGSESFRASMAYGYYKDFNLGIDYTTVSVLHIELEGLT